MEGEIITAGMCRNFKEFLDYKISENPNLTFGDGECPSDCKSYGVLE